MTKILPYIFLLIASSSIAQNNLKLIKNFGQNKGMLKMYSFKPSNLDTSKAVPLVVVLHGCAQNARSVAAATDWNKLADSLNFIVIYPEQRRINNASKCFNWFIGFKSKKDKGEVQSIKQMINYTIETANVDRTKIFITGLSAGGAMSNALLNAYPLLFNAGALLGTPSILMSAQSTDSIQPRVIIMQGKRDPINHRNNGDRLVTNWCKKHRIDSDNFILTDKIEDNDLLSTKTYSKRGNPVIVFLSAKKVGHKLLINPGDDIKHGGKKGKFTKNIGFFSTYFIADFFGLVKK